MKESMSCGSACYRKRQHGYLLKLEYVAMSVLFSTHHRVLINLPPIT